jgi:excinuclease ABC subunit C
MRNKTGVVLYVGKAKNLRQRLGSYRVANPERVSRRHLRLLREVTSIEVELCSSETTALALEARLLRRLKPRSRLRHAGA